MRIWSIHPKYLDSKGLVALWRETLLAKNVLEGNTRGYVNHPQLSRFKTLPDPLSAINQYLEKVCCEAKTRGYSFDTSKFATSNCDKAVTVNREQVRYEFEHLLRKLSTRDPERFELLKNIETIEPHPLFIIVEGPVEAWEIIK